MYGFYTARNFHRRILAFAFLWMMLPAVDNNDVGSRKTYIVRYTNGEFTIPVTVVLDYRKQAEYVINMNSRSPTKSVTFYDFKQKSIAYKDMSNRECFIGRLSFETLEEEDHRLKDVQNPVDLKPVVLNLDSGRSSLTPTEVRNIAGQKIAMFCRKMATWLLQESNKRSRRQVDQRMENRYQQYGRETHEYPRGSHQIYEVSYPRNDHQRRRENLIHGGNERGFHPPSSASHLGPDVKTRNFRGIRPYKPPAAVRGFPRASIDQNIPPALPLYIPSPNISIHTQHRHPLRNRNTIDIGGPTSYPLRGDSSEVRRLSLSNLHQYYDPFNFSSIRPEHARLPYRDPFTKPLRARQVNAIQDHLPVPHLQYVHELRSGRQDGASILPSSDSLQGASRKHRKAPESSELRDEWIFPDIRHDVHPDRNVTSATNDVHPRGNIYRETELGGYDSLVASHEVPTLNHSSTVREPPTIFHLPNGSNKTYDVNNETQLYDTVDPQNHQRTYIKEVSERSDLPEEDIALFPTSSPQNETKLLPQRHHTESNYSAPNTTVQEGLPPQKKRPQNVLELFTPDEIVIDIGKIPVPANDIDVDRFKENASVRIRGNRTKYHHAKKLYPGRRKSHAFPKNLSGHRPVGHRKRIHGAVQPTRPPAVLPPGIDVHPRHPDAPYAQLASPSAKRTMTAFGNRLVPAHHQRHERKKLRKGFGCCKPPYDRCCNTSQCCGRRSCCRSKSSGSRPLPKPSLLHNTTQGRTSNDMCDAKRLCRTLYQSTKAVKVCKLNGVPGC